MKPTQEQVLQWAREAGVYHIAPNVAGSLLYMSQASLYRGFFLAYEAGRKDEREKVAQWMIQRSYATGHGDTTEDLLAELEWQVREAERNGMVATAAELGWALYGGDPFEDGVRDVAAIRARGQS